MITLINSEINSDLKVITFEVSSSTAISSALLFNDCYGKDTNVGTDISSFASTSNSLKFVVLASDINKDNFGGVRFIKVKNEDEDSLLFVVYNLKPYYDCALSKLKDLNINSCGELVNNDCEMDTISPNEILYIQSLIEGLEYCLGKNLLKKVCQILFVLDSFCDICGTCTDFSYNFEDYSENPDCQFFWAYKTW